MSPVRIELGVHFDSVPSDAVVVVSAWFESVEWMSLLAPGRVTCGLNVHSLSMVNGRRKLARASAHPTQITLSAIQFAWKTPSAQNRRTASELTLVYSWHGPLAGR